MSTAPTRIRLDVSYDGGEFNGWTRQPALRTVQGELEAALETTFRRFGPPPTLTVAGRTDAGVHATGQVAHLDLTPDQLAFISAPHKATSKYPPYPPALRLARRLNGLAGAADDLYVTDASIVSADFDARYSALYRVYEYRVSDPTGPRHPVERRRTLWYPGVVDLDLANAAALDLLGLHDFASYCRPREGATTIRTLEEFSWRRDPDGVLVARVRADAFCHSMVRSLVGVTLGVGQGQIPVGGAAEILASRARAGQYKVAAAHGLTLVEVGYPGAQELAARADVTRARRSPIPSGVGPGSAIV